MKFTEPLLKGYFKKRYKRFFADVELETGELVVAHCPNTGSMTNCLVENGVCWLSKSDNPKRKLGYTLEAVTSKYGGMAGVNTGRTNKLVAEALELGSIEELLGYSEVKSEVRFGEEKSRLDFMLSDPAQSLPDCYVEVKNVTLAMPDKLGMFPDAVTTRGAKHLRELARAKHQGYRAMLFFCVQHQGIEQVRPAKEVDPEYYQTLVDVCREGVEVVAYSVTMSRDEFIVRGRLPFGY